MKDRAKYEHTQPGTLMRIILLVAILVCGSISVGGFAAGNRGLGIGLAIPSVVMLVALVLFHSLHVRVSAEMLSLRFGIGLIRKSFAVADIESAEPTRSRWYNGWGIKKIWGGWLFNVSGFDVVEIKLKNGKRYLIGTDQPKKLHAAIESVLANG